MAPLQPVITAAVSDRQRCRPRLARAGPKGQNPPIFWVKQCAKKGRAFEVWHAEPVFARVLPAIDAALPTSVSAPAWPVVAWLRSVIVARLWSVVIARLGIGAIKVCMPRGGAVAGAAVARTVIDRLSAIVRLIVISTLVTVVGLRLLIPLVEVVKQKRERKRKRNTPADLSLSWKLGGKEQTACCEQNNDRFHASKYNVRGGRPQREIDTLRYGVFLVGFLLLLARLVGSRTAVCSEPKLVSPPPVSGPVGSSGLRTSPVDA
jgi:hypothetical protein